MIDMRIGSRFRRLEVKKLVIGFKKLFSGLKSYEKLKFVPPTLKWAFEAAYEVSRPCGPVSASRLHEWSP